MSSKSKMWFQWLLIVILSFQFLGAAFAKLAGFTCAFFLSHGFTIEFMYFIGFVEALSVIGLYFKSMRVKASLVQMVLMTGALFTHLPNNEYLMSLVNITNIGLACIIIWVELDRRYNMDEMLREEIFLD